jgi:GTP-binding protein HflX
VGYTNAGKSTLLNALTNKWVLSEDKLFATLGTSVWKMWIAPENGKEWEYVPWKEVLLSDTIGFIRDLPPELVDAFASTLEDSIESDLLFHVVDASDPKMDEKLKVVDDILDRIWAKQQRIYVFNKTDMISWHSLIELKKRFYKKHTLYISTHTKAGFDELIQCMLQFS